MDISIIIVSWNTRDVLLACLESIRQHPDGFRLQTIVVDNDSSDGTRDAIAQQYPEVELINSGANLGFGRANNVAIPHLRAPFVLYLNPDTELRPGALRALMEVLRQRKEVGGAACRLTDKTGRTQPLGLQSFPTPFREFLRLAFYTESLGRRFPGLFRWADAHRSADLVKIYGACLLVRREIVEELGGFDDRYFMYCEDVDLCRQIIERGWKLHYLAEPSIIHLGAAASSKAPGAFAVLMTCHSINLYMRKFYGAPGAWAHRVLVFAAAVWRLAFTGASTIAARLRGRGVPLQLAHSARRLQLMLRWSLGLQRAQVATKAAAPAASRPAAAPLAGVPR